MFGRDTWKFIEKNKPPADRSIRMHLEFGLFFVIDQQARIPADHYNSVPAVTPVPWQDIKVTVTFDGQRLYQGSPVNTTLVDHSFQDSDQPQQRWFEIGLHGLSSQHLAVWPNTQQSGSVCLAVQGHIDHIPLYLMMGQHGRYCLDSGQEKIADPLLGENGYQRWQIETPFYTWLHQQRQHLIWQMSPSE